MYVPLISENGTVRELPRRSSTYRNEPHSMGIIARGISADGSIAYGTIWDNLDFGMVYWDKEGNVHYVGEDVRTVTTVQRSDGYGGTYDYNIVNGMISWAGTYQASPSGKYIARHRTAKNQSQRTGKQSTRAIGRRSSIPKLRKHTFSASSETDAA